MPRYKVCDQPTYIDNSMRQPGEIVEYAGWPGSTLEPADEMARKIKAYHAQFKGPRLSRVPDMAQFAEGVEPPKPKIGRPFAKKSDAPVATDQEPTQ